MKRAGLHVVRTTLLSASLLAALAACNKAPTAQAAADAPAAQIAAGSPQGGPASDYTPPTAAQLYALVSPIALFPDRLVALTLAGSTHADQIDAARSFLGSEQNVTGAALIDAADSQPWDPSVKSLVAFPAVLDQLASNRNWTQALGAAYANEPTDVMNAIQVMRGRAQARGTLKQTTQQTVQVEDAPVSQTVTTETEIVPAPSRTIVIEPAQSDVVYVPQYDPDEVYGEPVYSQVYRTHWYEAPVSRGDVVTAGLVSFGAGVLVGQLFASHDHRDSPRDVPHGGWNNWNTSWGRGPGGSNGGGRPSVVYDNHPYVVNRNTVVNRTVNNTYVDRSVHDHVDSHNRVDVHGAPGTPGGRETPGMPSQQPSRPDFDHMQRPNFTAAMARPTAPGARPDIRDGQPHPQVQSQTQPQLPPQAHSPEIPHSADTDNHSMQRQDPRVANVHAVGARPQPFDNNHARAVAQPAQQGQSRPGNQEHAQSHGQTPHEPPAPHAEREARPVPQQHEPRPAPQEHQVSRPPAHEDHAPEHRTPQNHAQPPRHDEHKDHEKHDG